MSRIIWIRITPHLQTWEHVDPLSQTRSCSQSSHSPHLRGNSTYRCTQWILKGKKTNILSYFFLIFKFHNDIHCLVQDCGIQKVIEMGIKSKIMHIHLCIITNLILKKMVDFLIGHYTYRMFPPAIDIIPTLLAVVYSNGKYTNWKLMSHQVTSLV